MFIFLAVLFVDGGKYILECFESSDGYLHFPDGASDIIFASSDIVTLVQLDLEDYE